MKKIAALTLGLSLAVGGVTPAFAAGRPKKEEKKDKKKVEKETKAKKAT
jgi:hypothetical protein